MNPIVKFSGWLQEARGTELPEPTAFTLASVGPDGAPSARVVLLKDVDGRGFVFYTNFHSRKSLELLAHRQAAMCFYWPPLGRQVRVEGVAAPVTDSEADAYFATRPRGSQLGAWASPQSQQLASREALEKSFADAEVRFAGRDVPRPPHWSGFRVEPMKIEFWTGMSNRLHLREEFTRAGDGWQVRLLAP